MHYTRELAQFAAQLTYNQLPADVIDKAKEIALHAWGLQLAGSTLPWSQAVYRHVHDQRGTPRSTIVNYGLKTSAVDAAFANGTFGHGFEMDDNHAATGIKGGCVVIPTVQALGEQQASTGKDLILAIAVAYEVMIRIGLSVSPTSLRRGHSPTGACGPFGAATASGKLLNFDEKTMLHAISIAASYSAGLQEAPLEGRGHLKRIYGGVAASNGIRAALLAKEGLTGPESMLEGERGFCYAFGGLEKLPALTSELGTRWHIRDVHYKIYAQDGYIQPMTEALERIVKKHRIRPEQVEDIRAGTNRVAHGHVIGVIREPRDLTSAQFSANFSLALFLVKGGAGFQDYTEEALADPAIVGLSKKIHTEVDPEIEEEWQKTRPRGARITLRLTSGEIHTECVHMLRSMTAEDVNEKFRRLASEVIGEKQCDLLMNLVRNLELVGNLSDLVPLLCRSKHASN